MILFENLLYSTGNSTQCSAAAAKSLQSCPTLCDPIDGSPPGSSIHGIFQATVLEWGATAAYKLNKQGDSIQPWHTPFPIWNQSVVPCPVLTIASWPAYRFLKRQVRQVVWYSHLFQNFPQLIVIHTVKGFGIVNKAEIHIFLVLLPFWWSSGSSQFDLWFLCLF